MVNAKYGINLGIVAIRMSNVSRTNDNDRDNDKGIYQ